MYNKQTDNHIVDKKYGLTQKQLDFCIYYVETGNIIQSALKAGYSEKTASQSASRLFRHVGVQGKIHELQHGTAKKMIATAQEVMNFFTKVMNGEVKDQFGLEASLSDRLKAANELAKRTVDVDLKTNGESDKEDETTLRLTDSFDKDRKHESDIEVKVRMININYGHNREILKACRPLEEYAWFIDRIREEIKKGMTLDHAVDSAIDGMNTDSVIRDFLVKHRAEVRGMIDTEYDEEKVRKLFKEEGRSEERINTERERKRADAAETRASTAEAETIRAQTLADRFREQIIALGGTPIEG